MFCRICFALYSSTGIIMVAAILLLSGLPAGAQVPGSADQTYAYDPQRGWVPVAPVMQRDGMQQSGPPTLSQQFMKSMFPTGQPAEIGGRRSKTSRSLNDYKIVDDESRRAYQYAQTARYDREQRARQDAAAKAYDCARRAKIACSRIYDAARRGDPVAKRYYPQARTTAERARADADQARSDADRY